MIAAELRLASAPEAHRRVMEPGAPRDWKVIREVPRIKTVKVFPRDRMVIVEDEKRAHEKVGHFLRRSLAQATSD